MRKQRQPFCLATPFHRSATLRFVIPSEAEGSAVPRTSLGKRAFCPASTFHRIGRKTFPRKVRRNAGPSALLGMTKGRVALPFRAAALPASVQQPLSMEVSLYPLSSRATGVPGSFAAGVGSRGICGSTDPSWKCFSPDCQARRYGGGGSAIPRHSW